MRTSSQALALLGHLDNSTDILTLLPPVPYILLICACVFLSLPQDSKSWTEASDKLSLESLSGISPSRVREREYLLPSLLPAPPNTHTLALRMGIWVLLLISFF